VFKTQDNEILTAVNDTRARFVVLLLGAPKVLEGAKRSQNRSTNPHRVLSLRRSNDLDLKRERKNVSRAMRRNMKQITNFYA